MDEDRELEEARNRKAGAAMQEEEQRKILLAALEPDAYSRIMTVAMSSPNMYRAAASMVLNLIQSGRLRGRISDAQLRELLSRLAARKPSGSISIKRK